jgi:MYXO-CTERM domain-containing protein
MRSRAALPALSTALFLAGTAGAVPSAPLENWPCPGCLLAAPAESGASAPAAPRPLLVALHGDDAAVRRVFRAFRKASEDAGVLLLSLRCPKEQGCKTGSWWQWRSTAEHDPEWLGRQIDAVAARYAVDGARVYAAGYSGGGTYLGWYGPTHPERFAAIAHVAGGMPWGTPCPACKVPVYFVLGATDPMIVPYTRPLQAFYEGCGGHEVVWETLPGVTHESILTVMEAGRGAKVLSWLLDHRAACAPPAAVDAGAPSDAGSVDAATADAPAQLAPIAPPAPPIAPAPPRVDPRPPPGCACDLGSPPESGLPLGALLVGLPLLRRRRQSMMTAVRSRCSRWFTWR